MYDLGLGICVGAHQSIGFKVNPLQEEITIEKRQCDKLSPKSFDGHLFIEKFKKINKCHRRWRHALDFDRDHRRLFAIRPHIDIQIGLSSFRAFYCTERRNRKKNICRKCRRAAFTQPFVSRNHPPDLTRLPSSAELWNLRMANIISWMDQRFGSVTVELVSEGCKLKLFTIGYFLIYFSSRHHDSFCANWSHWWERSKERQSHSVHCRAWFRWR